MLKTRSSVGTVVLFGLLSIFLMAGPGPASAADFAPAGTVGVLTVKLEAAGAGQEIAPPGAGLDRREWKLKNSGQFTIRLKALEPVVDDSMENQEKMAGTREAYDKTFTEKDQQIQEKWEEKIDACDGEEACENMVRAQMMSDPEYQRIILKAQGAGPEMFEAAKAVDLTPSIQFWATDPNDPSPASGSLELDLTENVYGGIDTEGGGKVDVFCRWNGKVNIAKGSPEGKVGASLRVDAKNSTFEIRIPAEQFGAEVPESCSDSKTGSHGPSKDMRRVPLIGTSPPPGTDEIAQVLTFKGKLGSAQSPHMSGKETVTTDLGNPNVPGASRPTKVVIEWQFDAGGK